MKLKKEKKKKRKKENLETSVRESLGSQHYSGKIIWMAAEISSETIGGMIKQKPFFKFEKKDLPT